MIVINLFDQVEAASLREQLLAIKFSDGRDTARGLAKDRKKNKQIDLFSRENKELREVVLTRLMSNPSVLQYAFPRSVPALMANLYEQGDFYGWHTDSSIMSGHRSDISFTLFLSPKDSYTGGSLEVRYDTGVLRSDCEIGQMVVYPTGRLHRVQEVLSGSRLAIVGWLTSWVPEESDRKLLYEFGRMVQGLKNDSNEETFWRMNEFYHQFVRNLSS